MRNWCCLCWVETNSVHIVRVILFLPQPPPVPCKNISVFQAGCHFLCCQDSGTCLSISSVHFVAVTNSGQTHPFSPSISVTITTSLSFVMTQINTVLTHLFLLPFASILSLAHLFRNRTRRQHHQVMDLMLWAAATKRPEFWIFCIHWLAWVIQLPPSSPCNRGWSVYNVEDHPD